MYRLKIYFLALVLLAPSLAARTRPQPVDRDYLLALAVAGRFLNAWQSQDQETAILLLSDRLHEAAQEDRLQSLFSAATGDRLAYELCRGRKLAPGRYQFPVTLFRVTSTSPKWQHPNPATLIVVHTEQDWLIDKLP
jgi:hypothetical protein